MNDKVIQFIKSNHCSVSGGVTKKQIAEGLQISLKEVEKILLEESQITAWANQDSNLSFKEAIKLPLRWFVK